MSCKPTRDRDEALLSDAPDSPVVKGHPSFVPAVVPLMARAMGHVVDGGSRISVAA